MTNIPLVIGVGLTLSGNLPTMVVGRFIYGLSSGSFSVFVPKFSKFALYYTKMLITQYLFIVSETAPVELKGPVGVMTQLFITVGIMVSFLFGLALPPTPEHGVPETEFDVNNDPDWLAFRNDPMIQNYWRFMFGFPLIITLI